MVMFNSSLHPNGRKTEKQDWDYRKAQLHFRDMQRKDIRGSGLLENKATYAGLLQCTSANDGMNEGPISQRGLLGGCSPLVELSPP